MTTKSLYNFGLRISDEHLLVLELNKNSILETCYSVLIGG